MDIPPNHSLVPTAESGTNSGSMHKSPWRMEEKGELAGCLSAQNHLETDNVQCLSHRTVNLHRDGCQLTVYPKQLSTTGRLVSLASPVQQLVWEKTCKNPWIFPERGSTISSEDSWTRITKLAQSQEWAFCRILLLEYYLWKGKQEGDKLSGSCIFTAIGRQI